ncbi:uncharacterized protein BDV14DRAFT_126242 [Aspergillus stella-maris]|uniref:uncharacterized protein n=1 Tax=Aspergillus stella-maris TaxID=1810926 RepID=UPI003CCE3749
MTRQELEFRRSIQAYSASVTYGIHGLANLAYEFIQIFDKNLEIRMRGNVPDLMKRNRVTAYLERKMAGAFKQSPDVFNHANFVKDFGKDPNLDPFFWETMVATFSDKISELQTCNLLKDKILKINPPIPAAVSIKETEDNLFLNDECLNEGIDEGEKEYFPTPDTPNYQDTFCGNGTELYQFKQEESQRLRGQTQNPQIIVNVPMEKPGPLQEDGANDQAIEAIHHPLFPPNFFSRAAEFKSSSPTEFTPDSSSGETTQTSSSDGGTRRSDGVPA